MGLELFPILSLPIVSKGVISKPIYTYLDDGVEVGHGSAKVKAEAKELAAEQALLYLSPAKHEELVRGQGA